MRVYIGEYPEIDSVDQKRDIKVTIHPWDTWSLDHTLAHIIAPALKQFRREKSGVPQKIYEHFGREMGDGWDEEQFQWLLIEWHKIIDEMIFAFDTIAMDEVYDDEKTEQRVQQGLEYFGKFYQCLWN